MVALMRRNFIIFSVKSCKNNGVTPDTAIVITWFSGSTIDGEKLKVAPVWTVYAGNGIIVNEGS